MESDLPTVFFNVLEEDEECAADHFCHCDEDDNHPVSHYNENYFSS